MYLNNYNDAAIVGYSCSLHEKMEDNAVHIAVMGENGY